MTGIRTATVLIVTLIPFCIAAQRPLPRRADTTAPSAAHWVKRLDKNGDNKVSKREFDGPHNHFGHFDTNNDGYITKAEAPSGPPEQRRQSDVQGKRTDRRKTVNKYTGKQIRTIAGTAVAASMLLTSCGENTTTPNTTTASVGGYTIVDSGQVLFYNNNSSIGQPSTGAAFYGQDAQYSGTQPSFRDNGNGTVSDQNTGLMWQQDPGEKMTYDQAAAAASSFQLAGHSDWRLPTIKELYSLIDFSGLDPSNFQGNDTSGLTPFIDTDYFTFRYGNETGERVIDSQYASSTLYAANTANDGGRTLFGVNFADGRIKGYGLSRQGKDKTFYVMYVRGDSYGQNAFADNGDGTITDHATGLTWQKADSNHAMDWKDSLAYAERLELAGHSDWRLPNVKELQSIVDYSRSPDTTGSAAIDPIFSVSVISNEAGAEDYPWYWSGTTHADNTIAGRAAAYIAFGRSLGYMGSWVDVHGAGSQRSDPKQGDASDFPTGRGPQGDAIRINNYVRCVCGP